MAEAVTLELHVRASSPIPIFLQLKSQLEYMIVTGQLAPGVRLPSIRSVARKVGVGPATVVRAYGRLVESGLAVANGGVGFFVIGADAEDAGPHGQCRGRIAELLRDALRSGLALEQVVEIFMAQVADTRLSLHDSEVVLLCKRAGGIEELTARLRASIADMGVNVSGIAIEDVANDGYEGVARCRAAARVVALLFDISQARSLLEPEGIEVMPMLCVVRDDVRDRIVHLPPGTRIAVVASSEEFVDGMITAISHLNSNLIVSETAASNDREALMRILPAVDCVIYGTLSRGAVQAELPASTEGIEFVYAPDVSSVQRLRMILREESLR